MAFYRITRFAWLLFVFCETVICFNFFGRSRLSPRPWNRTNKALTRREASFSSGVGNSLLIAQNLLDKLEESPYYKRDKLPMNTFKHKDPLQAEVVEVVPLVKSSVDGQTEIAHVKLNTDGRLVYREGQSIGIRPPGVNPKTGKPQNVRLYSIASTRYGDDGDGKTVSLCVRRNVFIDPETNKPMEGTCSSLLTKASPGLKVDVVGPTGNVMLLPESTPDASVIAIATGTGIAPFRGFWRRMFLENSPYSKDFTGKLWLFQGARDTRSLLFNGEIENLVKKAGKDRFRVTTALSREEKDKCYVQHKITQNAQEIFKMLEAGSHIFFCGLKAMMPDIKQAFQTAATEMGLNWEETLKKWRTGGQWHVEVY